MTTYQIAANQLTNGVRVPAKIVPAGENRLTSPDFRSSIAARATAPHRCLFAPPSWAVALAKAGQGLVFFDEPYAPRPSVVIVLTDGYTLWPDQPPPGIRVIVGLLTIIQQIGTGASGDPVLGDGTVAADGPLYSTDGKTLWFPQTADLIRFSVDPAGTVSSPTVIPLVGSDGTAADAHGPAEPSGMALSADGSLLYVAFNGHNTLGVIDTSTNKLIKEIPVGNAPRQVVIDGDNAYVSNEGGRPATPGDFTNLSDGTPSGAAVRVSPRV